MAVFLVKTFLVQSQPEVSVRDWTENEPGFGQRWSESLAVYNRDSSSWKTLTDFDRMGSGEFSETWPKSGMMRSGIGYRLAHSVRLTGEPVFGWLATPTAAQNQSYPSMMKHPSCRNFVKVFGSGPISPLAYEWLMGFPLGWTDVEFSETP